MTTASPARIPDTTDGVNPVRLVIDVVDRNPPQGVVRTDGAEAPFTGWLELLAAIETAVA